MISLIMLFIVIILLYILSIIILPILYIIKAFNIKLCDNISYAFIKFILSLVKKISRIKINVLGIERIPKNKPILFVCNHNSLYDFLITFLSSPIKIGYMAKKEVKKIPFAKKYMDLIHCTYVDRNNNKESLKALIQTIDNIKVGYSMCIFPEGTRNKGSENNLLEFKKGFSTIASKSKSLIIPIVIKNSKNILESHKPFIRKTSVQIEFLPYIDINLLDEYNKKNIDNYIKKLIEERLNTNAI